MRQTCKDGDAGELPSRAAPPLQEVGGQTFEALLGGCGCESFLALNSSSHSCVCIIRKIRGQHLLSKALSEQAQCDRVFGGVSLRQGV